MDHGAEMSEFVGTINIHNVTAENLTCELKHLSTSTVVSIRIGKTDVNLFMDNDQAIAVKRILGA